MWQMWQARVAPAVCEEIIEVALRTPAQHGRVGISGNVDPTYRDSEVRFLPRFNEDSATHTWSSLYSVLDHYARWANNEAFGLDINFIEDVQFTTYREQRHQHFDWHRDTFWENPHQQQHRKLTAILQLSDPTTYEGCDLELDVMQPPCAADLRVQGTLLIFPSFVFHRVTPIKAGVRHSLVAWVFGPHWR